MTRLLGYMLWLGHCSKPGLPPPKPGARADLFFRVLSCSGRKFTNRATLFGNSISSANRTSYKISWLLNPVLRVLMRREHTPEPWCSLQCSGHTCQVIPHSSCHSSWSLWALSLLPANHPTWPCSRFSQGPFTLFLNLESCPIIY